MDNLIERADMTDRTCGAPDCSKPTRSGKATYCKMHYHRMYRHGRLDITAHRTDVTASAGRRYRSAHLPAHPLAPRSGRLYVHRAVLYDIIGIGPHDCHWCGTPVDWLPKGDPHCLHVDHLNGLGDDNRADNLVASCGRCNVLRGSQDRADALRAAGWWAMHDTVARTGGGRVPRVT